MDEPSHRNSYTNTSLFFACQQQQFEMNSIYEQKGHCWISQVSCIYLGNLYSAIQCSYSITIAYKDHSS